MRPERRMEETAPARLDPPYDGTEDELELEEEDWTDEEEAPGPPTEELVMPSDGREDDLPPPSR